MRLIDADAIDFNVVIKGTNDLAKDIRDITQMLIDTMPTIESEPVRHGKWLTWEDRFPGKIPKKKNNLGVFCSECGLHADNDSTFCPNCGARMDGGEFHDN